MSYLCQELFKEQVSEFSTPIIGCSRFHWDPLVFEHLIILSYSYSQSSKALVTARVNSLKALTIFSTTTCPCEYTSSQFNILVELLSSKDVVYVGFIFSLSFAHPKL